MSELTPTNVIEWRTNLQLERNSVAYICFERYYIWLYKKNEYAAIGNSYEATNADKWDK